MAEEGYLIAQSYIPAATAGDVRLFVMNGVPLERGGKFAALRRVPAKASCAPTCTCGASRRRSR